MSNYNVEQRNGNGSWFRHSNHSNEYTANSSMDNAKRDNPDSQYRVVDDKGNTRGIR